MVENSSFFERNLRDEPDADALGVVASLPLTNCHGTVFTVDIQLNSQPLTVALDTSVSGLWLVNSKDADSSAANPASLANVTLSFDMVDYEVQGVSAKGDIQLGTDLTISNQPYTQLKAMPLDFPCETVQGILGLGRSMTTNNIVPNLLPPSDSQLRNALYSLYTTSESVSANKQVTSALLTLGGVDQRHYQNCLTWHDVGEFRKDHATSDAWEFVLERVSVGSVDLPESDIAMVDSSVYDVVAPISAIEKIAQVNKMLCAEMDKDGAPEPVDCDFQNSTAASVLVVDCQEEFQPLELNIGSTTYVLKNTNLVVEQVTPHGPVCFVRLRPGTGEGWILGGVFLNAYYTVLDFKDKRVGFAIASDSNSEVCAPDWELDIRYNGTAWIEPTPSPVPAPPHSAPHANPPHSPARPQHTKAPTVPYGSNANASTGGNAMGWLIVLVFLVVFGCGCIWYRGSAQRRRRQAYARTSRYQDDWAGDMELT